MQRNIKTAAVLERKELVIGSDKSQKYIGDHIVSYGDRQASLYDLSQVYAIKHDLWAPAVNIVPKNKIDHLYVVYCGKDTDDTKTTVDDSFSYWNDEIIRGINNYCEAIDEASVIKLLMSSEYDDYIRSKQSEVKIKHDIDYLEHKSFLTSEHGYKITKVPTDISEVHIGERHLPINDIGELLYPYDKYHPIDYVDDGHEIKFLFRFWGREDHVVEYISEDELRHAMYSYRFCVYKIRASGSMWWSITHGPIYAPGKGM